METPTETGPAPRPQTVVTVVADSEFVLPVFILVLSLKSFQPMQRIHILGISLSEREKALFTRFEKVFVYEASIERSDAPGAMRIIADLLKGEALLTARDCEEPWVALLDGDCIATGDISPYLAPGEPALYARTRTAAEDTRIFTYYRRPEDPPRGIPASILNRWREDVGQRSTPARDTTVLSGNLLLHRDYLDFAQTWKDFMESVLDPRHPEQIHTAYYMPAEFTLSAWLFYAENPPPLREVQLNSNPAAYLAHLGPAPRYWRIWTRRNLQYFDPVVRLLENARRQGIETPVLPAALKKRNKVFFTTLAILYDFVNRVRKTTKKMYRRLAGNNPDHQARRYGQQRI